MLLGNYFHNIDKNYRNFYFSGISSDTKSIKKNNIFFAIKGNTIDGNKFIPKAIKKGSKIIVTEKKVNQFQNGILYIHTKNIRILNRGISEQVVSALRKIVNTKEGTAKFADVQSYEIGGKTGTADQPEGGAYSEAKINTFASIFLHQIHNLFLL